MGPSDLRKYVFALYGLTRTADEIVDDQTRTVEQMKAELTALQKDFFDSWNLGTPAKHKCNRAALLTARTLGLRQEMFQRFFAAMMKDIMKPLTFETMDELLVYMEGSAAVIGEMMLPVLVGKDFYTHPEKFPDHAELVRTARSLGFAFQLTNFCRDVLEDSTLQRIYLPLDVLQKHGVSPDDIFKANMSLGFAAALEECLRICDDWYADGAKGIQLLAKYSPISSECIGASHALYSGISEEIRKNNYDVFSGRFSVGTWKKLSVLLPHLMTRPRLFPEMWEVLAHHVGCRMFGSGLLQPPPMAY